MLPDFMVPYKHYDSETISGVIDETVTSDDLDSENYPCEMTMQRWKIWFRANTPRIDGTLRSVGYRELGFSRKFLKTGYSLLDELRASVREWLEVILSFIYNSGNHLEPVY